MWTGPCWSSRPVRPVWSRFERIRRLPLDAPLWETQIAPLSLASIPIDALAVDACGLGASVAEQLESELPYLVFPTITTGSGDKPVYKNGRVYVSKTELIKTLMLAVNRGAVRVTAPKHEADILKKDMLNFRVQQTRTGLRLEAAAGAKDDAVLAYARAFMAGAIARQQHLTQAQDMDM